MKFISELFDLMPELISETLANNEDFEFSERAKAIIKEIAEYSRTTKVFTDNKERGKDIFGGMSAKDIYMHLIEKIANAPTTAHLTTSAILCMPFLDDELGGENERGSDERILKL